MNPVEECVLNETIQMIINAMVINDSNEETDAVYYEQQFYREPGIYRLPEAMQPIMFDMVLKMGSVVAIKAMQRILVTVGWPIKCDGEIGPRTVASAILACKLYGPHILDKLAQENIDFTVRNAEKQTIKRKPVTDNRITGATLRAEQVKVVKTFGTRMKEAREIAGFTQIQAAALLGYSNSSKLAKVELASDTNSVPLWLIPKAAIVYDVSTDFLFGISEDWERDPTVSNQRNIGHWIFEHFTNANAAQVSAFVAMNKKLSALEKAVAVAVKRSRENLSVMRRVQELNPEFDELRGGSKLVYCMDEAVAESDKALSELKRYHCLIDVTNRAAGVKLVRNLDIFEVGGEL
jgi:transcriptional regulator with XRE-family HTH domain